MGADRELLQRAAKAAGIDGMPYELYPGQWWIEIRATEPNSPPTLWNPLEDDGDALRLAVKLGIHLGFYGDHVAADCTSGRLVTEQRRDGDVQAATRRVIVRAAAAMPEGGQG